MTYSPILAVATAAFEIVAAAWAFTLRPAARCGPRHARRALPPGGRTIARTTGVILLLLAGYQLTEVAICADVAAAGFLPRLAFILVTWLPALGLLLIAQIHRPASRFFYGGAAAMLVASAGMVTWAALDPSFATASVCRAVFAHYVHALPRFQIYAAYYWAGLLGMVVWSAHGLVVSDPSPRRRWLAHVHVGTLAFVLPSIALSYVVPSSRGALPSVMCHFALVLALSLTRMLWVMREEPAEASELTRSAPSARI